MGKKGSKRKTRWRTLSIGAPPEEEDEKEGLRNGYTKSQESSTGTRSLDRSGQGGYKPRRATTSPSGTSGSANGHRSHKQASGSSSEPKIIFNEDEYTRITTPGQDVLFKKGWFGRKKLPGNASTSASATPSTTESQSASHSTTSRDGSETTEDQQLLDTNSAGGEYPPVVEHGGQLGYGTFYDHASGYYGEYPVMLVGPGPVPPQVGPSVLAAVPCGPVPLRPIEWINPAFMPKLVGQPYCLMNYQDQSAESATLTEEQDGTLVSTENSNGTWPASCSGSVAGETEEQTEKTVTNKEQVEDPQAEDASTEEQYADEQQADESQLENGMNCGQYLEPIIMQQPVHISHMIPAVPQPYMYPGHYMFGPPLVNVNGVTIQSGPMIRTTNVGAMTAGYAKRWKKKKRRIQRRTVTGNTKDEEEGGYSSECDNGSLSSRLSWTGCSNSSTTMTTTTNTPLNPECQEFQLRSVVEPHTTIASTENNHDASVSEKNSTMDQSGSLSSESMVHAKKTNKESNGIASETFIEHEKQLVAGNNTDQNTEKRLEDSQSAAVETNGMDNEMNRLTSCFMEGEAVVTNDATQPRTDGKEIGKDFVDDDMCERSKDEINGINNLSRRNQQCSEGTVLNGELNSDLSSDEVQTSNILTTALTTSISSSSNDTNISPEKTDCRASTPITACNIEMQEPQINHNLGNSVTSNGPPKRKYSGKSLKFVREPTPGPDLDSVMNVDLENGTVNVCDVTEELENINLSKRSYSKANSIAVLENSDETDDQASTKSNRHNKSVVVINDEVIEGSNEDSGFESQTRLTQYPITEAVTEWLRKANSPDLFIISANSSDSETEDEDNIDEGPPKNLQSNPMPALSANSDADNGTLSRTTSCGKFARVSNIQTDQVQTNGVSAGSRKKRDTKGTKRKSGERNGRRNRQGDGKTQNEVVSSSDSCGQQEESVNSTRKKNLLKQDVDEICEFAEKDSVAGMRVASSSRMDSKRVNGRRMKRLGKCSRDSEKNIDMKIRCIDDVDNEDDEGIVEDAVNVRTFEKGEIVVSEDGKLLTTSSYDQILFETQDASIVIKTVSKTKDSNEETNKSKRDKENNSEEEGSGSTINSLESIEEPDVLECWEAETVEPVITPKKMLQSQGIICDGEAAEDDNIEDDDVNLEHVQKYYRLARGSATSTEEDMNSIKQSIVPKNPEQMIESFCSEEIPVDVSHEMQKQTADDKKIPIDEAFEVYESCYTGKAQFTPIDSKIFKPRTLYGQESEGAIPCRAVCCSIQ